MRFVILLAMRRVIWAVVVLGLLSFYSGKTGIDFQEGNVEEALLQAKEQNKVLFVDAMAAWCGPCKQMKKKVFTDPELGTFFNDHFINVALDIDSEEGKTYRNKWNITVLPTLLFINPDGTVQEYYEGFASVQKLKMVGQKHQSPE